MEKEKIKKDMNVKTVDAPKFAKEQILQSNRYSHKHDLLSVLLEDNKVYSHADIKEIIEKYMKEKVR